MEQFWRVIRFEFLTQSKRRAYLFMTFGVPILAFVLLTGYEVYQDYQAGVTDNSAPAQSQPDEPVTGKIGYVDHSGMFSEPGLFGMSLVQYDTDEAAIAAMNDGEVDTIYVVAEDYVESGRVDRYVDTFSIESLNVDGFFQSFLMDVMLSDVDREIVTRLKSSLVVDQHRLEANGDAAVSVAQDEDAAFWLVYVFAILLAFATFFSGGYLMQSVIQEKESRMVEILLSTVKPMSLLSGKILASGILGLVQVSIWMATAIYVLERIGNVIPSMAQLNIRPDMLLWTVIYFVVGYVFFAGVYAGIGAVSSSMREGPQYAVFITLPAMIPFYFITFFVRAPHDTLATGLSLFPITAPMAMIQRLAVATVPIGEVLLSLGLLALTAVGTMWMAGRLFRVNTLLEGSTPKLRELPGIILRG